MSPVMTQGPIVPAAPPDTAAVPPPSTTTPPASVPVVPAAPRTTVAGPDNGRDGATRDAPPTHAGDDPADRGD
jgi:hypothetical protein